MFQQYSTLLVYVDDYDAISSICSIESGELPDAYHVVYTSSLFSCAVKAMVQYEHTCDVNALEKYHIAVCTLNESIFDISLFSPYVLSKLFYLRNHLGMALVGGCEITKSMEIIRNNLCDVQSILYQTFGVLKTSKGDDTMDNITHPIVQGGEYSVGCFWEVSSWYLLKAKVYGLAALCDCLCLENNPKK